MKLPEKVPYRNLTPQQAETPIVALLSALLWDTSPPNQEKKPAAFFEFLLP